MRLKPLGACLMSVLQQTISPDQYEIILVNNSPRTDSEVRQLIQTLPENARINCSIEPKEGLSFARNHGISLSKGEILVFIDDDAVAESSWLEDILKTYREHPDAAIVGGKINLCWENSIPKWLHPELYGYLGELDYGDVIFPIQKSQRLGGGNFSIKKSWLEKCGGFSTRLGRNRKSFLSGEETELFIRVWDYGGQCYYNSEAIVTHPAPLQRMNKNFFRQRVYWGARSDARIDKIHFPEKIINKLLAMLIRLPYHFFFSIWYKLTNRPSLSFLWETFYWNTFGYFVETIHEFANS
jgi:GT2 family glycosyltransferase